MLIYKYFSSDKERLNKYRRSMIKAASNSEIDITNKAVHVESITVGPIQEGGRFYFAMTPDDGNDKSALIFNMDIDKLTFGLNSYVMKPKKIEEKNNG